MVPDVGNVAPDVGNVAPDVGNEVPDVGNEVPDVGNEVPDVGNGVPDEFASACLTRVLLRAWPLMLLLLLEGLIGVGGLEWAKFSKEEDKGGGVARLSEDADTVDMS